MKTNPKSNYKQSNNRQSNYKQSNNRQSNNRQSNHNQSIRTRKNKKVGKRRTMKGGTAVASQIGIHVGPKPGEFREHSPVVPLNPKLKKFIDSLREAIVTQETIQGLNVTEVIKKAKEAQQDATDDAKKKEIEILVNEYTKSVSADAGAQTKESPTLTRIPDIKLKPIEDAAEEGIFLVNEVLDLPERFDFAVSCFRNFKEYGCPYTELKFAKGSEKLVNKIASYSDCFDSVETLDLSQTTITKLPMNFSKMMSLKYVYLPKTITSRRFYDFAVKVPTLRVIDVPGFYDREKAEAGTVATDADKAAAAAKAAAEATAKAAAEAAAKADAEAAAGDAEAAANAAKADEEIQKIIGYNKDNIVAEIENYLVTPLGLALLIPIVNSDTAQGYDEAKKAALKEALEEEAKKEALEEAKKKAKKEALQAALQADLQAAPKDKKADLEAALEAAKKAAQEEAEDSKTLKQIKQILIQLAVKDLTTEGKKALFKLQMGKFEQEMNTSGGKKGNAPFITYNGIPSMLFELREPVKEEKDDKVKEIIDTIFEDGEVGKKKLKEKYKHLLLFPECVEPSLIINLSGTPIKLTP